MTGQNKVPTRPLSLAAADAIRNRINAGEYPPGFQLRQEFLAVDLGMSRIPVREALLLLEPEGLVRLIPHRGAVVVGLSIAEIREVFEMRAILEPHLLERSAWKLTDADFDELKRLHAEYERFTVGPDLTRLNELNDVFHMTIYRHADSPRVMAMVENLIRESDRYLRLHLLNIAGTRERAVAEHATLISLCQSGNFGAAKALMREHVNSIGKSLVDFLVSKQRG